MDLHHRSGRSSLKRSNSMESAPKIANQHQMSTASGLELTTCISNAYFDGLKIEKTPSEITLLKADSDLKKAETVVVVMGATGVGKSRFIREATGANVEVGDSLYSTTSTVQAYHCMFGKRSCALVDTPGFDDTHRSDAQVFHELAAWLAARYQEHTRLTAILYMQRISDTRMSGSILRNLMVMKRMLGIQSFPHLTLVTSMWDMVDVKIGTVRERMLIEDFWAELIESGARIARFDGSKSSVAGILETISASGEVTLAIQQELVDDRMPLARTAAGIFLSSQIRHQDQNLSYSNKKKTEESRIGTRQQLEAEWDPQYGTLWLEPLQDRAVWDSKVYQQLDTEQFRLIKLSAGNNDAPLELSILVKSFNQAPRYAALSYVVGTQDLTAVVNFRTGANVQERAIAANLKEALLQLRRQNTDVLIWVDQLSINQEDDKEKAQQISSMNKIFGMADNVCIWLGPSSQLSDRALDLANRILDLEEFEVALSDRDLERSTRFAELATLMASPWFTRRWCVQELLLARSITVHCGGRVMRWSDFADAALLLASRWGDLKDLSESRSIAHAELVPAIALIDLSKEVVRCAANGQIIEYRLDLECLLWRLATFEVTMLHDTIYAIRGLANDLVLGAKLLPDYSMDIVDLFSEVTEMIVRSSGSLDIVCRPWAPNSGLPSWIPTVKKAPYSQRRGGYHFQRQNADILVGKPQSRIYQACGEFTTRGSAAFHTIGTQHILSTLGNRVAEVLELKGECINGNIPRGWLELAGWNDCYKERAPEQFWRTLVADRSATGSRAPDWYRRACETAFRSSQMADIDTEGLCQAAKSPNIKEFLRRVQSVVWSRCMSKIKMTIKGNSKGREFVTTSAEHQTCLCPSETREGDILVILYGCSVPVLLRSHPPYYKLIGQCFVLGIMDGEAVDRSALSSQRKVFDLI